jgi:hypothetical protein
MRVSDAIEYEIEWLGTTSEIVRVPAAEARCMTGTGLWEDLDICSLPFPSKQAPLEPGKTTFVRIGARMRLAGPLRGERDAVRLRVLTEAERTALNNSMKERLRPPFDRVSQLLVVAGAYLDFGIYGRAMSTFHELVSDDIPEARIRLGELFLVTRLPLLARREFERALANDTVLTVRAAAEVGLGRIEYSANAFDRARLRFEAAVAIYRRLGLEREELAARTAAERSAERTGR